MQLCVFISECHVHKYDNLMLRTFVKPQKANDLIGPCVLHEDMKPLDYLVVSDILLFLCWRIKAVNAAAGP